MKRLFVLLLILALALPLCACGARAEEAESGRLSIVTTVFPAYDFARQVAGEQADVTLLVPPGAEVHSFEPTAQDMRRIQSCDLLICNGGESEAWLETLLAGQEKEIPTLVMLACVDALEEELKEGMQETEEEAGEDGTEYDEHVWTSPVNAQKICRAVAEALGSRDEEHRALYQANCEAYCGKLAGLDAAFRRVVEQGRHSTVIFADRFPVRYFVEEYGLEYFAAFPGCAEDTEPAAGTVAFLIDRVREEQLPAVFYIEFSNEKMADVICEDTGCKKLLFHSCHNVTADQLKSGIGYCELMQGNVESLREALG